MTRRIVVIGSGMAGLTAARRLTRAGHDVVVLDKGRRPGGRMATDHLAGGARADKGAQFFTVRSAALGDAVDRWADGGLVYEWCRGFGADDGHPRYAATGGMASLMAHLAEGLDVRQSVRVGAVRPEGPGWIVRWRGGHGVEAGGLSCRAVVLTTPVPQSAALLGGAADVPHVPYDGTLTLTLALDGRPSVPSPGGVQLDDDPTWSWVGDNRAKAVSPTPAVTLHTTAQVARARWDDHPSTVTADLLAAARVWLGGAGVLEARLQRWRYATPSRPHPERCLEVAAGALLAGDAFGGPRVEGAYLSGMAVADLLAGAG